ncbi:MAG TPA: bi-domain-containing oxidoreductase [Terriglobales bacterium]|nr:bi-domain-containing oxidoreductase [Terriglobales bacterium]
MKQLLQDTLTGAIEVAEVPAPQLLPGTALVRIAASVVSAGTERAASEFARKNLWQKAKARPDLVREVFNKVRRDGVVAALQTVRSRLDQPVSMGYSSAGTVIAVHPSISDIHVGDRVACAGAGYAVHADVACVPRLLLAKFPASSEVAFEEAAFTTLGAVALHGLHTAEVRIGEVVAVIGLGLIGQLTVQLLKAGGCRVIGMDVRPERAELAKQSGADAVAIGSDTFCSVCLRESGGAGVDSILITAETPSSGPVNLAAEVARDRAIIVAVGTVGMDIERKLYYGKELDFRVSRSYGPGRYDTSFEQKGRDYPIGYVRWTETRNMEAFLRLMAEKKLNLSSLITHRFPIARAASAYNLITNDAGEPCLGVVITYPGGADESHTVELRHVSKVSGMQADSTVRVGLLGAGNFAVSTLIPAMTHAGVKLMGLCAATGASAQHKGRKYGFEYCTTEPRQALEDPRCNTVVVATRHHLHACQTIMALRVGKHVFCEKPLCLSEEELLDIVNAYRGLDVPRILMVGFNRRFSSMALQLKAFFADVHEPLVMHYRVNAGIVAQDHWVRDPEQGGGRVLGEICHFVDFVSFLANSFPTEVQAQSLSCEDSVLVSLRLQNESSATITYVANGDRAFSKERLEVMGGGRAAVLEDFRRLELANRGKRKVIRTRWRQDKGHRGEWQAFVDAITRGKPAPICFEEIVSSTLATLRIEQSLATGQAVAIDADAFMNSALQTCASERTGTDQC